MKGVAALLLLLLAGPARAGEYHYQNFLLGERAMALGGAYAALSGPSSAWYNPAGLAFVSGTTLSVQTGVYGVMSDTTPPAGGFVGHEGGQFVSFPSTAVLVKQIGGDAHRFAFSILTPDYDYRGVHLTARDVTFPTPQGPARLESYSIVQDDRDTTLWVGPSYALRAHRRLALGVSLFFPLRLRDLVAKGMGVAGGQLVDSGQLDLASRHLSVLGMAGLRAEIADGVFVGVAFRTPNLRIASDAEITFVNAGAGGRSYIQASGVQYKLPWRLTAGLAWVRPRQLALTADVNVYGAVAPYPSIEDPRVEGQPIDARVSEVAKKTIANVSVGFEYYVTPSVPLRVGFFTNFSAQARPRPDLLAAALFAANGVVGGEGAVPNLYGVTFGFGYEREATSVSLGVNYLFGSSTSILGSAEAPRDLRYLLFGLAGSYGF